MAKARIVGIGEVLWDVFADQRRLGGAPLNFVVHCRALGADARIISRIGTDPDGDAVLEAVKGFDVPADTIQRDPQRPTGRVLVSLDATGKPAYDIVKGVAWDAIETNAAAAKLIAKADAICFGTLAQRSETSRESIQSLLGQADGADWIVCDLNFRQEFYSREVVETSLSLANVLKLNEDEVSILLDLVKQRGRSTPARIHDLMAGFGLAYVCVTKGAQGCTYYDESTHKNMPGYPTQVVDTVGAGDAFTAGLVTQLLQGKDIEAAVDFANRVGAYVAGQPGGTPKLDHDGILSMRRSA